MANVFIYMKTECKDRILNYEHPQVHKIELSAQEVMCTSTSGSGESSQPGTVLGADSTDAVNDYLG